MENSAIFMSYAIVSEPPHLFSLVQDPVLDLESVS
jgi:hypothetical protein